VRFYTIQTKYIRKYEELLNIHTRTDYHLAYCSLSIYILEQIITLPIVHCQIYILEQIITLPTVHCQINVLEQIIICRLFTVKYTN